MSNYEIMKVIDDGVIFYLDFFADAIHMKTIDNGVYRIIKPRKNEKGICFVYDIKLEHLTNEEVKDKIAEIKSLSLPIWWPLHSKRIHDLLNDNDQVAQLPNESDEFYMMLLPENQLENTPNNKDIKRVEAIVDFKIWVDIANQILAGGYQDIHPINHYSWCEKGKLIPYIAYVDNKPAAIAAIMDNKGIASLEFVATLEEYRRKGLAKAVCVNAIRNAFANGAKIITTRAFYPANLIYQSLGFKRYDQGFLVCQSCAMPMTKQEDFGTEKDSIINQDYCHHCYESGALHKDITMDKLITDVQKLVDIEGMHPNLLSTTLLEFIKKWLDFDELEKIAFIPTLHAKLVDGQDCDYTGTQWEKDWLADGKVCHCIACVTARKCVSDIKLMKKGYDL